MMYSYLHKIILFAQMMIHMLIAAEMLCKKRRSHFYERKDMDMIKYGKKLINVLKNDIAFFNELHFQTRQKKPLGEDYDKKFRPIFDEIIEKGDDGQRAFAREMNKGRICCAFAGEWTKKYKRRARIITDKSCGLNYTFYNTRSHGRKKLFFMKQWEKAFCRDYIRCLLMEQDVLSPHFYFTDTVMGALRNGGTMLDMGVGIGRAHV